MNKLVYSLIFGSVLVLASCGSDEEKTEDKTPKKEQETETDTTSVDTVEADTGSIEVADTGKIEEVTPPPEVLGQEEKSQAASVTKVRYKLSEYTNGMYPISLELPSGSKLTWDSDYEELTIAFGNDFEMVVGENYEGTISEIKSKFKNTVHNQHLGYVKDEPNGIIKKSKANGIETHQVFYTTNANDMDILVSSVPSKTYSLGEIMEIWNACKTIQAE